MHCDVGKSDGSDRKIERLLFLWCCYNNTGGGILAFYEKEKGIRRVVIKIHKLKTVGEL